MPLCALHAAGNTAREAEAELSQDRERQLAQGSMWPLEKQGTAKGTNQLGDTAGAVGCRDQ